MTKLEKVHKFAEKAHEGQFRKFSTIPYITHPRSVSNIVKNFGGDINQQCAALLHDVVEDCGVTYNEIVTKFGYDVGYLVFGLTSVYDKSVTSQEKHDSEVARYTSINDPRILLIKLADILDNVSGINSTSPTFKARFLGGKKKLFDLITFKDIFTDPNNDRLLCLADALLLEFLDKS